MARVEPAGVDLQRALQEQRGIGRLRQQASDLQRRPGLAAPIAQAHQGHLAGGRRQHIDEIDLADLQRAIVGQRKGRVAAGLGGNDGQAIAGLVQRHRRRGAHAERLRDHGGARGLRDRAGRVEHQRSERAGTANRRIELDAPGARLQGQVARLPDDIAVQRRMHAHRAIASGPVQVTTQAHPGGGGIADVQRASPHVEMPRDRQAAVGLQLDIARRVDRAVQPHRSTGIEAHRTQGVDALAEDLIARRGDGRCGPGACRGHDGLPARAGDRQTRSGHGRCERGRPGALDHERPERRLRPDSRIEADRAGAGLHHQTCRAGRDGVDGALERHRLTGGFERRRPRQRDRPAVGLRAGALDAATGHRGGALDVQGSQSGQVIASVVSEAQQARHLGLETMLLPLCRRLHRRSSRDLCASQADVRVQRQRVQPGLVARGLHRACEPRRARGVGEHRRRREGRAESRRARAAHLERSQGPHSTHGPEETHVRTAAVHAQGGRRRRRGRGVDPAVELHGAGCAGVDGQVLCNVDRSGEADRRIGCPNVAMHFGRGRVHRERPERLLDTERPEERDAAGVGLQREGRRQRLAGACVDGSFHAQVPARGTCVQAPIAHEFDRALQGEVAARRGRGGAGIDVGCQDDARRLDDDMPCRGRHPTKAGTIDGTHGQRGRIADRQIGPGRGEAGAERIDAVGGGGQRGTVPGVEQDDAHIEGGDAVRDRGLRDAALRGRQPQQTVRAPRPGARACSAAGGDASLQGDHRSGSRQRHRPCGTPVAVGGTAAPARHVDRTEPQCTGITSTRGREANRAAGATAGRRARVDGAAAGIYGNGGQRDRGPAAGDPAGVDRADGQRSAADQFDSAPCVGGEGGDLVVRPRQDIGRGARQAKPRRDQGTGLGHLAGCHVEEGVARRAQRRQVHALRVHKAHATGVGRRTRGIQRPQFGHPEPVVRVRQRDPVRRARARRGHQPTGVDQPLGRRGGAVGADRPGSREFSRAARGDLAHVDPVAIDVGQVRTPDGGVGSVTAAQTDHVRVVAGLRQRDARRRGVVGQRRGVDDRRREGSHLLGDGACRAQDHRTAGRCQVGDRQAPRVGRDADVAVLRLVAEVQTLGEVPATRAHDDGAGARGAQAEARPGDVRDGGTVHRQMPAGRRRHIVQQGECGRTRQTHIAAAGGQAPGCRERAPERAEIDAARQGGDVLLGQGKTLARDGGDGRVVADLGVERIQAQHVGIPDHDLRARGAHPDQVGEVIARAAEFHTAGSRHERGAAGPHRAGGDPGDGIEILAYPRTDEGQCLVFGFAVDDRKDRQTMACQIQQAIGRLDPGFRPRADRADKAQAGREGRDTRVDQRDRTCGRQGAEAIDPGLVAQVERADGAGQGAHVDLRALRLRHGARHRSLGRSQDHGPCGRIESVDGQVGGVEHAHGNGTGAVRADRAEQFDRRLSAIDSDRSTVALGRAARIGGDRAAHGLANPQTGEPDVAIGPHAVSTELEEAGRRVGGADAHPPGAHHIGLQHQTAGGVRQVEVVPDANIIAHADGAELRHRVTRVGQDRRGTRIDGEAFGCHGRAGRLRDRAGDRARQAVRGRPTEHQGALGHIDIGQRQRRRAADDDGGVERARGAQAPAGHRDRPLRLRIGAAEGDRAAARPVGVVDRDHRSAHRNAAAAQHDVGTVGGRSTGADAVCAEVERATGGADRHIAMAVGHRAGQQQPAAAIDHIERRQRRVDEVEGAERPEGIVRTRQVDLAASAGVAGVLRRAA